MSGSSPPEDRVRATDDDDRVDGIDLLTGIDSVRDVSFLRGSFR